MPDFRQIIHNIKKKDFAPVYILMGEEPYYIDRITEALEQNVVNEEDREFDQTILYGAESDSGKVMEAAGQYPMWSEKRLVILKEAQAYPRNAKGELDKLKPYVEKPSSFTVLCIVFKGDNLNKTSELLKAAKRNSDVVIFESPKIKDYLLPGIVKDYCSSKRIKIEEKAIERLVANVGSSVSNLFSQLEKLRVAAGEKGEIITAELVSDNIGISKDFNNYELKTALSRRDYFQTLNILKQFEVNPKANPTQVTLAVIFGYFQNLLVAAFSADKTDQGLMDALGFNQSWRLKEIRAGLQFYNASQLVKAIHAIREFDTMSKGIGSTQKEFPLLRELLLRLLTL